MQNRPSADPRDQAIRAALADASSLAAMLTDEFIATYRGSLRDVYVATLAAFVVDLGGRLEETQGRQYVADFGGRRIGVRFR
jgi:hypothetical protein